MKTESLNKAILFLSNLDFKEKSIQVIRKTPEAYVKDNWLVHYVVVRDGSKTGNYFYEDIINPLGIFIYRSTMPLTKIYDFLNFNISKALVGRVRNYLTVLQLAYNGYKILKKHDIDIVYGYEVNGVLAANCLKRLGFLKKQKIVSRFQGVFYVKEYLRNNNYFRYYLNYEHILALKLPSDLCIMTNDGTQGDIVLEKLHSKNLKNLRFWTNGVDEQTLDIGVKVLRNEQITNGNIAILTVCRLENIKRVDRGIRVIEKLIHEYNLKNITYFIVGEGTERSVLEKLSRELRLEQYVKFIGAIKHEEVKIYLNIADYFISTFESSNVGNPLLEAIRAHKIIFTLNNGDTGKWIQHRFNGFIYNIDDELENNLAKDLHNIIINPELKEFIQVNIKKTEVDKLWTWKERMEAEILEVNRLLK